MAKAKKKDKTLEIEISSGGALANPLSKDKSPDEHEIGHWADTLARAEDIKNDPKKMKHLKPYLGKKIKSLQDMAKLASEMEQDELDSGEA